MGVKKFGYVMRRIAMAGVSLLASTCALADSCPFKPDFVLNKVYLNFTDLREHRSDLMSGTLICYYHSTTSQPDLEIRETKSSADIPIANVSGDWIVDRRRDYSGYSAVCYPSPNNECIFAFYND